MKNQLLDRFLHLAKILSLCSALHLVLVSVVFAQGINLSGRVTSKEDTEGLPGVNVVEKGAIIVVVTDIDVILDERGRELLGEYHRWFDLKRTGKLVERASAHHMLIEESNFVGNGEELKILRPIPQAALDLNQNPDFQQNPTYNKVVYNHLIH